MRIDGTVGTMPTGARMWSLMDGRELEVPEMAKLMGHHVRDMKVQGTSSKALRRMLGMSVHVAVAGYALIGLLASLDD